MIIIYPWLIMKNVSYQVEKLGKNIINRLIGLYLINKEKYILER